MPRSEVLLPASQKRSNIQSTPRGELTLYPLETFPYEFPGREIRIKFEIPEFTAICPFSDFPDFATIRLEIYSERALRRAQEFEALYQLI